MGAGVGSEGAAAARNRRFGKFVQSYPANFDRAASGVSIAAPPRDGFRRIERGAINSTE